MTLVEIMAKAAWDIHHPPSKPWEEIPEIIRRTKIRQMEVALAALAEAELPQEIVDDQSGSISRGMPSLYHKIQIRTIFENICLCLVKGSPVSCTRNAQAESDGSAQALPNPQSTGRDTRLHNDCDGGFCCACQADEEDGKITDA